MVQIKATFPDVSALSRLQVGVILHVVLAIANGIPSRCNITVSSNHNNNIMSIKSLKAEKYLSAELRPDGVRTVG